MTKTPMLKQSRSRFRFDFRSSNFEIASDFELRILMAGPQAAHP
jgi:hypothetical protein